MTKQEYVNALRELADYVESKTLPDSWQYWTWGGEETYPVPSLEFSVRDKKTFGEIVSTLGTFEKVNSDSRIAARVPLSAGAIVSVNIAHEQVCEKVVVGKKTVPFRQAFLVEAVEEHEEDIVEWKCPESFIALKGETNEPAQ